ncbi:MAG TPA: 30S ribosomal protein S1, partial [Actinotalea sp.]|nr:30S ribosomal protein S1 [Actinotalea sp.]
NYKYPEGFDPETNEWMPGFEAQREAWEAHKKQVAEASAADTETAAGGAGSGGGEVPTSYSSAAVDAGGTLASDEALAALREKLTGH